MHIHSHASLHENSSSITNCIATYVHLNSHKLVYLQRTSICVHMYKDALM